MTFYIAWNHLRSSIALSSSIYQNIRLICIFAKSLTQKNDMKVTAAYPLYKTLEIKGLCQVKIKILAAPTSIEQT